MLDKGKGFLFSDVLYVKEVTLKSYDKTDRSSKAFSQVNAGHERELAGG